jgi:hypothetical protein
MPKQEFKWTPQNIILQKKPMVAEIVKKLPCMYEMQKIMRFHMNLPLEPTANLFQSTTTQLI